MKDGFGREIDYLRISVTDRCNLRCMYCMPQKGIQMLEHKEILSYEAIEEICQCLAEHGLKKIKITGGEPLVRKNLDLLIQKLKAIHGIEQVTLTTNGVLLEDAYESLVDAGIDAITVSVDTLDPNIYEQITGRDCLETVLRGLDKGIRAGKVPMKINCVPMKPVGNMEWLRLLDYAKDQAVDVRFIEMMPIGLGKQIPYISSEDLISKIEEIHGKMNPFHGNRGNGPAVYYEIEGFKGKIGLIRPMSHKFCHQCNRIRLTANGFLKTCLQYDVGTDLKQALNSNLWSLMENAILNKPKAHHFEKDEIHMKDEQRVMAQIGG